MGVYTRFCTNDFYHRYFIYYILRADISSHSLNISNQQVYSFDDLENPPIGTYILHFESATEKQDYEGRKTM